MYLWGTSKNNDFLRIKLWLDDEIEKVEFKNWIVWVHEVKIHKILKDRFLHKHEDLLFYGGINNVFNIQRDEPTSLQLEIHQGKYNESYFIEREKLPLSQQKIFKNGLQLGSPGKSWWKGPSNQSNGKKILKFPGYKSEWVCERIIKSSSNPRDKLLIPFYGSGTECFVSQKLDRQFWSYEIDEERYNLSQERINQQSKENNFISKFFQE